MSRRWMSSPLLIFLCAYKYFYVLLYISFKPEFFYLINAAKFYDLVY